MFHERGPTFFELAEQALTSTERGYDLIAPKFDYTPFRTPDAVLDAVAPIIGEPGSIGRALDVCSGTGAAMRMLRPLATEVVVGVDTSRGMLDEARRRLEADREPRTRIELVRADALDLPFDEQFDVATCFGAFGHILEEDEPRFVASIARALRPGGRFVFVTGDVPSKLTLAYWLAKGFNAAMRVRNAIVKPEFIMYYLTFLLPRARELLEAAGFDVEVHRGVCPKPFDRLVVVVATKRRS